MHEFEWTLEELQVAQKLDSYFRSPCMSLKEKLFNAKLIALYDLELHHFANESERERLSRYSVILDSMMSKLEA